MPDLSYKEAEDVISRAFGKDERDYFGPYINDTGSVIHVFGISHELVNATMRRSWVFVVGHKELDGKPHPESWHHDWLAVRGYRPASPLERLALINASRLKPDT